MRRILFVLPIPILIAGCMDQYVGATGLYPYDYKQTTKAYIEKSFPDPTSLRTVALSDPVKGSIGNDLGWIVCFQADVKNRVGVYERLKRTALLLREGTVVRTTTNAPLCKEKVLEPWPEMEGK
jgi:hypothetical protein